MRTFVYIVLLAEALYLTHAKTAQDCQKAYSQCDKHLDAIFHVQETHTNEEYCSAKIAYEKCMDGPTTQGCADKESNKRIVRLIGVTCGCSGLSASVRVLIMSVFTLFAGNILFT